MALMERVHGRSFYSPGVTGVGTTSVEFHQNPRGVCQDYGLASGYAGQRTLRLADGPDEVHRVAIAKDELRRYN